MDWPRQKPTYQAGFGVRESLKPKNVLIDRKRSLQLLGYGRSAIVLGCRACVLDPSPLISKESRFCVCLGHCSKHQLYYILSESNFR